jgi:surface protein
MGAAASMNNSKANETTSATKSDTAATTATTTTDIQQWVDTVAKLNTFVGLTPSVISQLTKQLVANNEAMSLLNKLGFIKADTAAVHVDAKLPPAPKDKEELQSWLIEYHCGIGWKEGQPKNGDKFTRGPPNLWDVRLITDMSELFNIDELRDFNEDISAWDVSNVKSMACMFFKATSFNQSMGNWNVQNVSNMRYMFSEATSFDQPIGNWNVQNVTNMQRMFSRATSFNQPIGNWNVENVSNMMSMFEEATSFKQTLPDEWAKTATYGEYEVYYDSADSDCD